MGLSRSGKSGVGTFITKSAQRSKNVTFLMFFTRKTDTFTEPLSRDKPTVETPKKRPLFISFCKNPSSARARAREAIILSPFWPLFLRFCSKTLPFSFWDLFQKGFRRPPQNDQIGGFGADQRGWDLRPAGPPQNGLLPEKAS
jgi:hypothetical protein